MVKHNSISLLSVKKYYESERLEHIKLKNSYIEKQYFFYRPMSNIQTY